MPANVPNVICFWDVSAYYFKCGFKKTILWPSLEFFLGLASYQVYFHQTLPSRCDDIIQNTTGSGIGLSA